MTSDGVSDEMKLDKTFGKLEGYEDGLDEKLLGKVRKLMEKNESSRVMQRARHHRPRRLSRTEQGGTFGRRSRERGPLDAAAARRATTGQSAGVRAQGDGQAVGLVEQVHRIAIQHLEVNVAPR